MCSHITLFHTHFTTLNNSSKQQIVISYFIEVFFMIVLYVSSFTIPHVQSFEIGVARNKIILKTLTCILI